MTKIAIGKILYARERVRYRERRKWQNRSALIFLRSAIGILRGAFKNYLADFFR